jgi:hypothetical protein
VPSFLGASRTNISEHPYRNASSVFQRRIIAKKVAGPQDTSEHLKIENAQTARANFIFAVKRRRKRFKIKLLYGT